VPSSRAGGSHPVYNQVSGRIVGGEPLDHPRQYKWLVTLQSGFGGHFCGGTLISPTHVLTAAHCTQGSVSQIQVGVHRQTQSGSDECVQTRSVASIINHERYDDNTVEHDISILVLSSPVDYDEIDGADMDGSLASSVGLSLTIAGWGTIRSGGRVSDEALRAFVPVVDQQQCSNAYGGSVYDGMMCAGFTNGGVDSCQGDSGGPLFAVDAAGKHILTGIVSWGRGCALPGYPGVYTRLSSYVDWVCEKTATATTPGVFCGGAITSPPPSPLSSPPPSPLSSASPPPPVAQPCADDPNYFQRGEACGAWVGYNCNAASRYGYSTTCAPSAATKCDSPASWWNGLEYWSRHRSTGVSCRSRGNPTGSNSRHECWYVGRWQHAPWGSSRQHFAWGASASRNHTTATNTSGTWCSPTTWNSANDGCAIACCVTSSTNARRPAEEQCHNYHATTRSKASSSCSTNPTREGCPTPSKASGSQASSSQASSTTSSVKVLRPTPPQW